MPETNAFKIIDLGNETYDITIHHNPLKINSTQKIYTKVEMKNILAELLEYYGEGYIEGVSINPTIKCNCFSDYEIGLKPETLSQDAQMVWSYREVLYALAQANGTFGIVLVKLTDTEKQDLRNELETEEFASCQKAIYYFFRKLANWVIANNPLTEEGIQYFINNYLIYTHEIHDTYCTKVQNKLIPYRIFNRDKACEICPIKSSCIDTGCIHLIDYEIYKKLRDGNTNINDELALLVLLQSVNDETYAYWNCSELE